MSKIHNYAGQQIDVSYDAKRCIHAAECVKRLSAVFDNQKRPWVQPDQASAEAIVETVHLCPSGALHYERKDGGEAEPAPAANTVQPVADGPVYVRGTLTLTNGSDEVTMRETRLALCRCGLSQNKPFCDNSHQKAEFRAPAGIVNPERQTSETLENPGGELTIKVNPNGSLRLTGNFAVLDADGESVFTSQRQWLCRCGGSQNKPFCDGTHKTNGFQAT